MLPPRLIVIGATGWYGKVLIHEYLESYGELCTKQNLLLIASKNCQVSVYVRGKKIDFPVHALSDLIKFDLSSYQTLVWNAFLLKNQIKLIGASSWGIQNEQIASRVFEVLKLNPQLRTIFFSSGAVLEWSSRPDYELDPYANLKMKYEDLLNSHGNCIVFYPYASVGQYVSNFESFALSSFISQALAKRKIEINAEMPVVRSYASVHDFSRLLLKITELSDWSDLEKAVIPATHTLELHQLAVEVISALDLDIPIIRPQFSLNNTPSIYTAKTFNFHSQLARFGLCTTPLNQQISEMATGIGSVCN
jgi:hypothetical protein